MATFTVVQHTGAIEHGVDVVITETTEQEQDREETEITTIAASKIFARVLFSHENRIRVLEGKAQITRAQFITALKGLV
jgi:hypothetical protein